MKTRCKEKSDETALTESCVSACDLRRSIRFHQTPFTFLQTFSPSATFHFTSCLFSVVFPPVWNYRGMRSELSQCRLYCNQLLSSGVEPHTEESPRPTTDPIRPSSAPLSTELRETSLSEQKCFQCLRGRCASVCSL